MREMTLEEIHQEELKLLSAISRHCEEHCITYYLAYGTLLGAIRHKGFIPWDDDADIWMLRDDFERFLATFKDTEDYFLIRPFTREYSIGWAKVVIRRTCYSNSRLVLPDEYGLSIDVFPLDGASNVRSAEKVRRQDFIRRMAWVPLKKSREKTIRERAKTAVQFLCKLLPAALYDEKAFNRQKSIGRLADDSLMNFFSRYKYSRGLFPTKCFGVGKQHEFEGGYSFCIPEESEKLLEIIYGTDWKTPVVDERHAQVFWRD